MKKLLILFIILFLFSCSQKNNILENLNLFAPSLDSQLYSDCENFNIPNHFGVQICSEESTTDTIIHLSKIDNRFQIQLNIEWEFKNIRDTGLKYINIVKGEKLLKKINLDSYIQEGPTEETYHVPGPSLFCNKIDFMDINLDSYLDIRILSKSGNSNSFYSFWVYNPVEEVFHYWNESPINLVNFNCKDQMIYSVDFHTADYTLFTAYKIDSAKQLEKYAEQEVVKWGEDKIKWKLIN